MHTASSDEQVKMCERERRESEQYREVSLWNIRSGKNRCKNRFLIATLSACKGRNHRYCGHMGNRERREYRNWGEEGDESRDKSENKEVQRERRRKRRKISAKELYQRSGDADFPVKLESFAWINDPQLQLELGGFLKLVCYEPRNNVLSNENSTKVVTKRKKDINTDFDCRTKKSI